MSHRNKCTGTYDFIIIGAGTAGCVLANKLSENPSNRVLLVEAGGWDTDPLIHLPAGIQIMTAKEMYRWADMSEPDTQLNGRRQYVPHGRVIGGGSSINYMAHTRCHPNDYNRWAANGADGWGWDDVYPIFNELENWQGTPDLQRGQRGPVGAIAGRLKDDQSNSRWFKACQTLGHPFTHDHNGINPEGAGPLQYTISGGSRCSSARAWLHPVLDRPNLTVKTDCFATKIIMDKQTAIGVELKHGNNLESAYGNRTILSLGAINSPHLLMLSGIGPADHLRMHGVPVAADLPVGKNLQDHLAVSILWKRTTPSPLHHSLRLDRAALNMLKAKRSNSGPLTELPGVILAYLKSSQEASQADLQFYLNIPPPEADVWFPFLKRAYQDCLHVKFNLLRAKSKGEILLGTTDPMARPRIHYNSLSHPDDLRRVRIGYKMAWEIITSHELSDYRGEPVSPSAPLQTDEEIDAYIRETAIQQYHPAGTCRMGKNELSVVDSNLSVHGIENLSVIDASIMPTLVSGNPNIPIMMIAAKGSKHLLDK